MAVKEETMGPWGRPQPFCSWAAGLAILEDARDGAGSP